MLWLPIIAALLSLDAKPIYINEVRSISATKTLKMERSLYPGLTFPLETEAASCFNEPMDIQIMFDKSGNMYAEMLAWHRAVAWVREMVFYFMGNPDNDVRMSVLGLNDEISPNYPFTSNLEEMMTNLDLLGADCLGDKQSCRSKDKLASNIPLGMKAGLANFKKAQTKQKRRKIMVYMGTGYNQVSPEQYNFTCGSFPPNYSKCKGNETLCTILSDDFFASPDPTCAIETAKKAKAEGIELFALKIGKPGSDLMAEVHDVEWLATEFVSKPLNHQITDTYGALKFPEAREEMFGRITCKDPYRLPKYSKQRGCRCVCRDTLDVSRTPSTEVCFSFATKRAPRFTDPTAAISLLKHMTGLDSKDLN